MTVLALRELSNALILRKREVHRLALEAMAVSVPFPARLLNIIAANAEDETEEDDDNIRLFERMENRVGKPIAILSSEFLGAVSGERYIGSNTEHSMASVIKHTESDDEPDMNDTEPSLEGWSDSEIAVVERSYHRRINTMTTQLRDVYTSVEHYILERGVYVNRRGDLLTEPFRGQIPVLSHDFLDPHVSADTVDHVLNLLHGIRDTAAPLPGEPAALNGFSSNTSNKVTLDLPRIPRPSVPGNAPGH